jgi:hypothetical protein
MDTTEEGNREGLDHCVAHVFTRHGSTLLKVRELASEVSSHIDTLSPYILRHTGVVCPGCGSVCCIDRHSRYAYDDIVYLSALGERTVPRQRGFAENAPCQFLGEKGCMIRHSLRPYRCTWYFCTPLLERIGREPVREYRKFIGLLQQITLKRADLLAAFAETVHAARVGPAGDI